MSSANFEFSNLMTAGFRELIDPDPSPDVGKFPVYGDFGSPLFNRIVIPLIAFFAPRALFADMKRLLKIFSAFGDSLVRRLDFDQEIILGSGRDPVAFYRALQNPKATILEINLPDFAALKRQMVTEKCRAHGVSVSNLQDLGMDLLHDDLAPKCLAAGIDPSRNLLVYEVGLTMYLSQENQERLFTNIDRLFRQMKKTCVLLCSSFDRNLHADHQKDIRLKGILYAIEKFFQSKILTTNHSPDEFFLRNGYRIVHGGETLFGDVKLDSLTNGLAVTGYVRNG